MDFIRAQWDITIYKKDGFAITKWTQVDDKGNNAGAVTVLGNDLPETKNVTYRIDGTWVNNQKYGRQFNAESAVVSVGANAREIIGYIASLKGCGKRTGEKIFERFGQDTFRVLDDDWERLAEVPRLSMAKAKTIKEAWDANKDIAEIYERLMKYGVTALQAGKIAKEFPTTVWDIIAHYPYTLTRIHGITFQMADALAFDEGFPIDDINRITAATKATLVENELDGHTGMIPLEFLTKLKQTLDTGAYPEIDRPTLVNAANAVVMSQKTALCTGTHGGESEQYIYRTITRKAELTIADEVAEHLKASSIPYDIDQMIKDAFREAGLEPDAAQVEAVRMVFANNLTIVTGGPGTGKTTIINVIKAIQKRLNPAGGICLLAPTGRAARRLSESTGERATTIHSRLHMFGGDDGNEDAMTADEFIDDAMVIVDESSMIDLWVMRQLLLNISYMTKIVLVGDPAQLQSVGCGAVFRDMINCNCIPTARLSRIFRQSQGSAIIMNAQKIEDGDNHLFTGRDFEVNDHMTGETLEQAMVTAYLKDARDYGIFETVCLVPTRKDVANMNAKIQAAINPPADEKPEFTYGGQTLRLGDIVMELQNQQEVVNGDIGRIVGIDEENKSATVNYYGKTTILYKKEDLERITLAYAMTVHKAQGSEYQSVITSLQDSNNHMKIRSIPYTAITRAKTICRFYGSYRALQQAILVDDRQRRQTLLAHDIKIRTGIKPLH